MKNRNEKFSIILLLLIAFSLRMLNISEMPPGLSGDEGINGSDALSINIQNLPLFFPANYGREPFYIYSLALAFKIIGVSTFTLRWVTVIYSIVGMVTTYIFVKRLWNVKIALYALSLISVSFWSVFISRVGLRAITLIIFETMGIYTLCRGLHRGSLFWLILAGVNIGLGLYTYIPGRLFPAVIISWLMVSILIGSRSDRKMIWQNRYGFILMTVVALIIFAPFGLYIIRNPALVNQRLNEVAEPIVEMLAGNFAPIFTNLWRVIGMFTLKGDPTLRYNIPGRPVFNWGVGIFFYTGLYFTIYNWRSSQNKLLLIWFVFMLAPTILSQDAPAFIRATGALPSIFIFPAIGIVETGKWVRNLDFSKFNRIFNFLVVVCVFLYGVSSVHAYFSIWPQLPRLDEVYGDRLALLAKELDHLLPLREHSQVMVVCYYASDVCRDMIRLQTSYRGTIRAYAGFAATVIPDMPVNQGDLIYLYGHALPLSPVAEKILEPAEIVRVYSSSDGDPIAAVYRLRPNDRVKIQQNIVYNTSGYFDNALEMLGYSLQLSVERGNDMALTLYWRVPDTFDRKTLSWNITLMDEGGNSWGGNGDLVPYSPTEWQSRDTIAQEIMVPISVDVPPGPLTPTLSMSKEGKALVYTDDNDDMFINYILPLVNVTGHPTSTLPLNIQTMGEEGEIGILDIQLRDEVAPGHPFNTSIQWGVLKKPVIDYALQLQLRSASCDDPVVFNQTQLLLPQRYPTSHWIPGESVRTINKITIPSDIPNQTYYLTLSLIQPNGDLTQMITCQKLKVTGRRHQFDIPDMQYSEITFLSQNIRLLGYDLNPRGNVLLTGQPLNVTLYWQAQATPTKSFTVFVHLYGPDGQVVTQHDAPPCSGDCLTNTWVSGEVLSDNHILTINSEMPEGQYILGVGLYDPVTLERVHIPEQDNNMIQLQTFVLKEP